MGKKVQEKIEEKVQEKVREAARKLLAGGKVKAVIGFEEGSIPLRAAPVMITKPEEAGKLVWNPFCTNNLAVYLHNQEGKVAIVAKGCDSRSIAGLIKERQVKREDLYIIGVPCSRMVDSKKILEDFKDKEIRDARIDGDEIILSGEGFQEKVKIPDSLLWECRVCRHRNPVLSDELAGPEEEEEALEDPYARVKEFEAMSSQERWEYFKKEAAKCIRCYACRNSCPVCYCKECFVDHSTPKWIGSTIKDPDLQMFHIVRAFHMAGRCVDCGSCIRACPMGIDIGLLLRKLNKDMEEAFQCEAALDTESPVPLQHYSMTDPNNEFM